MQSDIDIMQFGGDPCPNDLEFRDSAIETHTHATCDLLHPTLYKPPIRPFNQQTNQQTNEPIRQLQNHSTTYYKMTKIIFYNNRNCPYAQRVHITLKELGLEFEEVIIDLTKPREPWYLKINPVWPHPVTDLDS